MCSCDFSRVFATQPFQVLGFENRCWHLFSFHLSHTHQTILFSMIYSYGDGGNEKRKRDYGRSLQLALTCWMQFRRRLDRLRPFCRIAGHTREEVREILGALEGVYQERFP